MPTPQDSAERAHERNRTATPLQYLRSGTEPAPIALADKAQDQRLWDIGVFLRDSPDGESYFAEALSADFVREIAGLIQCGDIKAIGAVVKRALDSAAICAAAERFFQGAQS